MEPQKSRTEELERVIEQLKLENDILRQDAEAAEKRFNAMRCQAETNACHANALNIPQMRETLVQKECIYKDNLHKLCGYFSDLANTKIFRTAKLLQIVKNPHIVGTDSSVKAFFKILFCKLRGRQLAPEHTVFSDAEHAIASIINTADNFSGEPSENFESYCTNDESKLISIVLPVYNQAELVHESIDSVLAQTYRNWELIIINDGSSDNLYSAVKPYLADKRIHYFEQKNQKLPTALNNGFTFAKGELLTWTSADNNMRPQMLARLADFLNSHPDTDMVYADYMAIDDRGNPFTAAWFRPHNKYFATSPYLHLPRTTSLLNTVQDNFIGASFMYRRSTLKLIEKYDNALGIEDYDYWMRINSMLKISHLGTNEILYDYRVHDNSLNARAAELGIFNKVQKLMSVEQERFYFFFRRFAVYGSFDPEKYFHGEFPAVYCGKNIKDDSVVNSKKILMIFACELENYSCKELGSYDRVGVFFRGNEINDIGKYAWMIRTFNILCFVLPNSPEAARLDVFTKRNVCCSEEQALYMLMVQTNDQLFFEKRHGSDAPAILPAAKENTDGKIIILIDYLGYGGMEQVAYDMAKSFAKYGRSVQLVSVKGKDETLRIPDGINYSSLANQTPEEDFKKLLGNCDAVFAHYCTFGAKEAFEASVPFYQVVHNTYVWLNNAGIKPYTENDIYTTAYIAVSAKVAWYALERMKLPAEKMMIIENGIDFKRFKAVSCERDAMRGKLGYGKDDFVILNPASVYGAKNQMHLISGFARAYAKNSSLRLLIAGKIIEQPYFDRCVELIKEYGIENAVSIGNYFDNMADIYNACDAVALPSFWEGCSLAAAEAIHFQKPLLASNTGDIERQTNRKNCVIFDLPFKYFTDFTGENFCDTVFNLSEKLTTSIADGIIKLANRDYAVSEGNLSATEDTDKVFSSYLAMLNYQKGGLAVPAVRHNI